MFLRFNGGETPVLSATPPKKLHVENGGLLFFFPFLGKLMKRLCSPYQSGISPNNISSTWFDYFTNLSLGPLTA